MLELKPRGRGMLVWEGKQNPAPPAGVSARLVEVCDPRHELPLAQTGLDSDAPRTPDSFLAQAIPNALYCGDNQAMLAHLLEQGWQGKVKLVYIDPPFGSGGDYTRKVRLRNRAAQVIGEEVEYRDAWNHDDYLQFMYTRLLLLRELLAENGTIWLHSDYRQAHRLHLVLEEVFGAENYLNTISWRSQVARGAKVAAFYFPFSTQTIAIFAKNREARPTWHAQKRRLVFTRSEAAAAFMEDERGFFRTSDPGTYSFGRLKELHAAGRIYAPYGGEVVVDEENQRVYASNGGNIGVKYYLLRVGPDRYAVARGVDNLWDDIPGLGTTPSEDVGYPTQKTEALLRRVIAAGTNPGDLVLDCFAGSGTTVAVAQQMGRRWIGGDVSNGAIQTTRRRVQRLLETHGPGFALYQVGDVPGQARANQGQARVTVQVEAGGEHAAVTIAAYQPDPARFAGRNAPAWAVGEPWPAWVEAVEIDPAYDGSVFRAAVMDLPRKRGETVRGDYRVTLSPGAGRLAVRITDVFGAESMVTYDLTNSISG